MRFGAPPRAIEARTPKPGRNDGEPYFSSWRDQAWQGSATPVNAAAPAAPGSPVNPYFLGRVASDDMLVRSSSFLGATQRGSVRRVLSPGTIFASEAAVSSRIDSRASPTRAPSPDSSRIESSRTAARTRLVSPCAAAVRVTSPHFRGSPPPAASSPDFRCSPPLWARSYEPRLSDGVASPLIVRGRPPPAAPTTMYSNSVSGSLSASNSVSGSLSVTARSWDQMSGRSVPSKVISSMRQSGSVEAPSQRAPSSLSSSMPLAARAPMSERTSPSDRQILESTAQMLISVACESNRKQVAMSESGLSMASRASPAQESSGPCGTPEPQDFLDPWIAGEPGQLQATSNTMQHASILAAPKDSALCTIRTAQRPRLAKYVRVVQATVKLQMLLGCRRTPAAAGVEDMLQRIAVSLSSEAEWKYAIRDVFEQLKLDLPGPNGQQDAKAKVPTSRLEAVLDHWLVPRDHLPRFWAVLRKQHKDWESSVLPSAIDKRTLSAALASFLRRVRNMYVQHSTRRQDFILRNRRRMEEEYDITGKIRSGSYGDCSWVEQRLTKKRYVCKRISLTREDIAKDEVEAELAVMRALDHPNVLRLFEWFENDSRYAFILEAAAGGDLQKLLSREKEAGRMGLAEELVQEITAQALHGLVYMHSQNFIHRDVKPSNMLLSKSLVMPYTQDGLDEMNVLLADFGLAELFPKSEVSEAKLPEKATSLSSTAGSPPYMALETYSGKATKASDVWALGVSVYELLCHQRPYHGDSPMAFYSSLRRMTCVDFAPVEDVGASESALQFVGALLRKEQSERPTAGGALALQWIAAADVTASKNLRSLKGSKYQHAFNRMRSKDSFSKVLSLCGASQIDTSSVRQLNKAFKAMDSNRDGVLSPQELKVGLLKIGIASKNIESIVDAADVDQDGQINYSEFIASLIPADCALEEELMERAFHVFDTNGDGNITQEELRTMLSGSGPMVNILPDGVSIEEVLQAIDTSGDGNIQLEELRAYLKKDQGGSLNSHQPKADRSRSNVSHSSNDATTRRNPDRPQSRTNGAEKDSEDGLPLGPIFAELGTQLRQQALQTLAESATIPDFEVLCTGHSKRLLEQHWLVTVGDLRELAEGDWPMLGLPMKLQSMLKARID